MVFLARFVSQGTPRTPLSPTPLNKSLLNGHASKPNAQNEVNTPSNTPNTTDNNKKKTPRNRSVKKNSNDEDEDDEVTFPKRGSRRSNTGTSKAKADLTKIKPKDKAVNGGVQEEPKSLEVNEVALTLKESFAKVVLNFP